MATANIDTSKNYDELVTVVNQSSDEENEENESEMKNNRGQNKQFNCQIRKDLWRIATCLLTTFKPLFRGECMICFECWLWPMLVPQQLLNLRARAV